MLKRIVKMVFRKEETENFKKLFNEKKTLIRDCKGCNHLELWQSKTDPRIFFTYSFWDSEADLENYRNSELFDETWRKTKALFDGKPEAWSVTGLEYLP